MWDRGREELAWWPCSDLQGRKWYGVHPEKWLADWDRRIAKGNAVVFGDCDAILGCDPHDGFGVVTTSFQASKSFEAPGVGSKITKEIRRAIPELMRERKAMHCYVYSLCVHPDAEKWFRLLGLSLDDSFTPQECGPYTMKRFWRKA